MRVVFMGTPEFAVASLRALLEAGLDVVGVVTQPDRAKGRGKRLTSPPVKVFAQEKGLRVLQPKSLKDPAAVELIRGLVPEVIAVVAYGKILPPAVLAIPPLGCINVHASLLPKYRGSAPIHRAVMAGEPETGVTTMFMDEGLDTGDMLLQVHVPIGPDDNVGAIHDRLAEEGARLLVRTLARLADGYAFRIPQDHSRATYAPPISPEDEVVDWRRPAREIHNQVRGLDPRPGARTTWDGRVLKVWRTAVLESGPGEGAPGLVAAHGPSQDLVVAAGDGWLILRELQLAGGRRVDGRSFLRGHPEIVGSTLGVHGDRSE
ncbi:MAG: methionyl-tRNA formyltransferase [Thermoanaerobacterales bacterium]|nr:methionyl-tRNA formyltransferase [Thermoanaerobacterales bacterium]